MENGKALTVREAAAVQEQGSAGVSFSREKVELLKRTVAAGASDDELQLFLAQATRMGLDPFAKQIHFVKRGSGADAKGTIQVAIDGYRLIADRTGKYAGNDDPEFEGEEDGHPLLARVTVWKLVGGLRCSFTATARWAEYVPQGNQGFMWRRMPHVMLGKVAEALALRKAFPAELSGAYVDAEMDQADEPAPKPPSRPAPKQRQPGPVGKLYCADCRGEIVAVEVEGQTLTAEQIAESTHRAYKRQLCWTCRNKVKAALAPKQTEPAPEVVEGEVVDDESAEF